MRLHAAEGSWMTGSRRRRGDETRVMDDCVGLSMPTQSGTLSGKVDRSVLFRKASRILP